MGFFKNLGDAVGTMTGIKGGSGGGLAKFLSNIAPALPIVGGIASNVLAGINNRKARLYNSPAEQIKRMREAGLPLAAGSNISAGGGVSTQVQDLGLSGLNDNLGKSIIRNIDRKKLQIHQEELRAAKYAADIAQGNAKNQLNPAGMFENTNQGMAASQAIQAQEAAIKGANLVNQWMPIEKAQNILKSEKEIAKISADTANSLAQHGILISEGKIKSILANWQEKMSKAEYDNLIKRNTGLDNQNAISLLQGEILRNTKLAQIHAANMAAIAAGQNVAANNLGLIIKGLETESAKAYYQIRAKADKSYLKHDRFTPADLIYLQLFTPTQSSVNLPQFSNIFK